MSAPPVLPADLWLDDDFGTTYSFFVASGKSVHDCAIIGQRYSAANGFLWNESESWLIRVRPTGIPERPSLARILVGGRPWLTRVWMSPGGRAWVSSMDNNVHQELDTGTMHAHLLPVPLSGVWGLDDRALYAWSEVAERMFRFDGGRWTEMPCPGKVLVMSGVATDDLLASGYDGAMWRWDGQTWHSLAISLAGAVPGLYAPDTDHAYACSGDGDIAEITRFGAQVLVNWPGPLLDVTTIGPDVFLAASVDGLLRVPAGTNTVLPVDGDFAPERFDKRDGNVLITTPELITETTDGETFGATFTAEYLRDQRQGQPPLWKP